MTRSEQIATHSELIHQAEERYQQATAAIYPTLSGFASYTWQDSGARDLSTSPTHQPLARITATQPLFRGFREFAAMRQTQALLDAQGGDFQQARAQLMKDVAQNFYDILTLEQDVLNLGEQIHQYQQRIKELQDRVRIGRSRSSEVLTIDSVISTLRAQVEQRKAELGAAREVFAFLSGLPAATRLHEPPSSEADLGTLDEQLARLSLRPDVKAVQQRQIAARENVAVARGARLPSLDLNANRYLERRGSLENVDWDVQLVLTVPLYDGGILQSRVREAISQNSQAELSISQVRRQAEQEIRTLYQNTVFDRAQLLALEKATAAAQKNHAAQQRDYRLGLVTNLEVLQAQTSFQENQRALDRARYSAKLNILRLQIATARQPVVTDGATP